MTLLQWKPSFALGIPSMDLEHRKMIRMINDLDKRLEAHPEPAEVEAVLGDIHSGIAAHFALEERIMRSAKYTEYAAHKDHHEELLDQIRDLMDIYRDDPQQGRVVLEQRLSGWFSRHFATFDSRLHNELG